MGFQGAYQRCAVKECNKPCTISCDVCAFHFQHGKTAKLIHIAKPKNRNAGGSTPTPNTTISYGGNEDDAAIAARTQLPDVKLQTVTGSVTNRGLRGAKVHAIRREIMQEKKLAGKKHRQQQDQARKEKEQLKLRRSVCKKLRRQGRIEKLFDEFDVDGDGSIQFSELKTGLRSMGYPLKDKDYKIVMDCCDLDGDGGITIEEFRHFLSSKPTQRKQRKGKKGRGMVPDAWRKAREGRVRLPEL